MNTFLCPNCNYSVDVDLQRAQGLATCIACNTQFEVPLEMSDDFAPLGDAFQFGDLQNANPNAAQGHSENASSYGTAPGSANVNWNEASAIARAKSVGQNADSSSDNAPKFGMLTAILLSGSLVVFVLVLLIIGVIYWMQSGAGLSLASNAANRGDDQSTRPRASAKQSGKEVRLSEVLGVEGIPPLELGSRFRDSAKHLLFDEPLPGVQADPYVAPDVMAGPVPKISFVEQKPLASPRLEPIDFAKGNQPPPTPPPAPLAAPLAADPLPADRKYTIASDLQISLPSLTGDQGTMSELSKANKNKSFECYPPLEVFATFNPLSLPIMASQNGPYMVVVPQLSKAPAGWKFTSKQGKWIKREVVQRSTEPVSVIDIRTGQTVGKFSPHVPFWLSPVLSPDGKTLVGPNSEPPRQNEFSYESVPEDKGAEARRQNLYVWKRDSNEAPKPILVDGEVKGMTFANDRALVLLVEGDQRRVEVWDTLSGKRARSIPVAAPMVYREMSRSGPIDYIKRPPNVQNVLAVSCGGKYAAVACTNGIQLLSLPEGKPLEMLVPKEDPQALAAIEPELYDSFRRAELDFNYANADSSRFLGHEFLPSGDRLAITFRNGSSTGRGFGIGMTCATQWMVDLTRGQIVGHEFYYSREECASFLSSDGLLGAMNFAAGVGACNLETRSAYKVDGVQRILMLPTEGPLLALYSNRGVNEVRTLARDEFLKPHRDAAVNGSAIAILKRSDVADVDAAALQHRVPNPPEQFKAIPKSEPAPVFEAQSLPGWPVAWSNDKALLFDMDDNLLRPQRMVDLTGQVPTPAWQADRSPGVFAAHTRVAAGLSPSNTYYAIALDRQPGQVNIFDGKRNRALYTLSTRQKPAGPITWTDFDANEILWTLENGILTTWKVDHQKATAVFALHGNYESPGRLTPDRKTLFIASCGGTSIDAIDTATGDCLARLTCGESQYATEMAISPDGTRLAVMYSSLDNQQRRERPEKEKFLACIWDLFNGSMRTTDAYVRGKLAWVTPNHLLFTGAGFVHDLVRNVLAMRLDNRYSLLEQSPDGRFWGSETTAPPLFQLSALTRNRTGAASDIFDKDAIFDFSDKPVQLVLNLGDKAFSQQCAGEILEGLQKKGWKIGPSQYSWYVTAKVQSTDKELIVDGRSNAKVPCIVYSWQLIDRGNRAIIKTNTSSMFDPVKSKYYTGNINKPLRLPDNPARAIADELLETRPGMGRIAYDARTLFIYGEPWPVFLPAPYELTEWK